jgi:crotonobetainyl-CoA:carnitine CoA-transferase CaiB-like acyl-CoA transferase
MIDAYAAFALPESMMARSFPPLTSNAPGINDVFQTFATADGFVVGLFLQDHQFQGLCRVIGRADLAADPRFATTIARFQHFRELTPALHQEIAKWPTADFVRRAREEGAPFAPAHDVDDFLADAQVAHNQTVFEADDPRFGPTRYLRHPVRYEATPAALRRHAPRLGEHTDEVLEEAGFTQREIAELRAAGALG